MQFSVVYGLKTTIVALVSAALAGGGIGESKAVITTTHCVEW